MNRNQTLLLLISMTLAVTVLSLPKILNLMGLHPSYEKVNYELKGQKVLIITTSQDKLGQTEKKTGVYASEMSIPYYEFLDAGMHIDIASIEGGTVPLEPMSMKWPLITSADQRLLKDEDFLEKIEYSFSIDSVDFTSYDLIYIAGGWGAAYDLGQSELLGKKISEAYASEVILGSVCHGALGFIKAVDSDGAPIVQGKHITAVTDKQVKELRITTTPLHPETELRKLGAIFESETAIRDFFATHVVVDGLFVTGQNQNSGGETAQEMMKLLTNMLSVK